MKTFVLQKFKHTNNIKNDLQKIKKNMEINLLLNIKNLKFQ